MKKVAESWRARVYHFAKKMCGPNTEDLTSDDRKKVDKRRDANYESNSKNVLIHSKQVQIP